MSNKILRHVSLGVLVVLFFTCNACDYYLDQVIGNGNMVEEQRMLKSFNAIQVGSSFEVVLIKGDNPMIVIEADENIMQYIVTEVQGKTLKITTEARIIKAGKMRALITYEKLNDIRLSGAAVLSSDEILVSNDLNLRLSGASKADLAVRADDIDLRLSGASKLYLQGVADEMECRLSGSSRLQADDLELHTCNIRSSGASKADLRVSDKLDVRGSGSSIVTYQGAPKQLNTNTSGASSVRKR